MGESTPRRPYASSRARFVRPAVPQDSLVRPRLHAQLDEAGDRRLTLVAAAAGYGKSVLLSTWAGARAGDGPLVWLTLKRPDRDGVRLGRHLLDAVRQLGEPNGSDGGGVGDRLATRPGEDVDQLVELVLTACEGLAGRSVLVLDDVHEVGESDEAVSVLDRLLREAPAQLRLVMASRADPPLALNRLRMVDELALLRHRDLAFTEPETYAFLQGSGLDVSPDEAAVVAQVTEGWPAGVRMVALSLRDTADMPQAVAGLATGDRALTDYLTGEVVASLTPRLRSFVLSATVADDVCGPLIDAVTGGGDGEALLAECERQHLFLTHSHDDEDGRWYAWHHVFATHMRLRARFEDPGGARDAHLRAAVWWRGRDPLAAVHHALSAPDPGRAAEVLADAWLDLLLSGRSGAVLELLPSIPAESPYRAELELSRCLAHVQSGAVAAAAQDLRRAVAAAPALPEAGRDRFEVRAALVRLFLVDDTVSLREAVARAQVLNQQLAGSEWVPDPATEALASLYLGLGEVRLQQDVSSAVRHLERAQELADEAELPVLALMASSERCLPLIASGELDVMEALAGRVVAEAAEQGWPRLGSLAVASSCLGWLAYWRGDLAAADEHLSQARGWLSRSDRSLAGLRVYTHGRVHLARGDLAAAQRAIDEAQELLESGLMAPYWASMVTSLRLERMTATGDLEAALAVVEEARPPVENRLTYCSRAEVLRRVGRPREALRELDAIPVEERFRNVTVLGGVIRSLARTALGDENLAHADLEQALAAAAPHGLLQPFLARSDELGPQLAQHLRRGTAYPELVARLLDRAALPPDQHVLGRHEALTPRELTMLRYLSTPLSHGEIAAEQFVSVNTVKTHVAKIYRKLGVSGRREAVRRAEELGLLG